MGSIVQRVVFASLILGSSLGLVSNADANSCTEYRWEEGIVRSNRSSFGSDCWISIGANGIDVDLVYRDYMASQDGMLMVFNSYGFGPEASSTGARVYYFFPRGHLPYSFVRGESSVAETGSPLLKMTFSNKTARITGVTNARVIEANEIIATNQGGVEFFDFKGLILDNGFALGRDPRIRRDQFSHFQNTKNERCRVRNRDIFNYTSSGDVQLKFRNDQAVYQFVQQTCGPEFLQ